MKHKCKTHKCKACCCYNIPFEHNELERFSSAIVNPLLFIAPLHGAMVAFTHPNPKENKCPFLRADYKCNIYENRPQICKLFGEIKQLPCKYLNK